MTIKKVFILVFSFVLLASVAQIGTSYAVEDADTPTTNEQSTKPAENTPTQKDILAQQERIDKRKAAIETKLTNSEKIRLKGRCKAAQGRMKSVIGRVKGIETSRSKIHANIIKHLTGLSVKLKDKGIDTTELDADIVAVQELITKFNDDFAIYLVAITDLEAMDCTADPDGFKASLDAAREALDVAKVDAQAVRSYVKDTVKPHLQTIRQSLEKTEE